MSVDPDALMLDRVFQPATEGLADWTTCFDLARLSVVAVIVLHTAVLAWNLVLLADPILLALITGGTLIGYRAASQLQAHIRRAERQSRPGMMNLHRVLLRPFRMAWLLLIAVSAIFLLRSAWRPVDICNFALCASWLAAAYFSSCSPVSPAHAARLRVSPAWITTASSSNAPLARP